MLKKKITKILIGTNNVGKLREIKDLLPRSAKVYSTKDFKIKSPIENGKSFLENSLIKGKIVNSIGKIKGFISSKKKGKNGFGYDPIFKPLKSKFTFGEMKLKYKHKVDHRFKAFKKIKKFF